jgi:hypothetical protein
MGTIVLGELCKLVFCIFLLLTGGNFVTHSQPSSVNNFQSCYFPCYPPVIPCYASCYFPVNFPVNFRLFKLLTEVFLSELCVKRV